MNIGEGRFRASDGEREHYAQLVREAIGEGRLGLDEGDERLAQVYAARFRDELPPLVADLPAGAPVPAGPAKSEVDHRGRRGRYRGPYGRFLMARLGVLLVIGTVLAGVWALTGGHFFWPGILLFFIGVSLVRRARWRH